MNKLGLESYIKQLREKEEINKFAYKGDAGFKDTLFWPDPTSKRNSQSRYGIRPIARRKKLFDKSTKLVSIGSCFAEEVSKRLVNDGYNYIFKENDSKSITPCRFSANWGIVFNPLSLAQNIKYYFGYMERPSICWTDKNQEFARKVIYDPFREDVLYDNIQDHQNEILSHRQKAKSALTEAEVLFVTLGMTECWKLSLSEHVVARSPWKINPLIGEFINLSVSQIEDQLIDSFKILKSNNKDLNIILTVSPVPLHASFRKGNHVIESNNLSKSTLRVACENITQKLDFVNYFPAFEVVSYCSKNPWTTDERHVNEETIRLVFDTLAKMYGPK